MALPNGFELSCRASRIRFRTNPFSAAGPVSCSELLDGPNDVLGLRERCRVHAILRGVQPALAVDIEGRRFPAELIEIDEELH
jgi:hypothetical protein